VQRNKLKIKTLDDLLAQAKLYATMMMIGVGQMPPTLFLNGQGAMKVYSGSFITECDKDDFTTNARLLCIAHAATAVVFVTEAWFRLGEPGDQFREVPRPSEAIDRQEGLSLSGESRAEEKYEWLVLPILRSDNGKFFGFSAPMMMNGIQGRFASLLSKGVPEGATRTAAKAALKVKGFGGFCWDSMPCVVGSGRQNLRFVKLIKNADDMASGEE
jgi:hypothetical protein